ncbi:MAG: copper resistance protein NlpE N-terminal domain-containing protein [Cellvibrio sp.]
MKVVSPCLILGVTLGLMVGCEKSPPTPVAVERPNSSLAAGTGVSSSVVNRALSSPAAQAGTVASSLATASVSPPDMHVSRNSLDWAGVYKGTPVCANCETVEYSFELKDDNKYTLTYTDPETSDQVKYDGEFKWDETGNSIGVSIDGYNYVYRVTENGLVRQATDAPSDAKIVAPLQYKKAN